MTIRVPGKVVFMVPWPRHWVIGTTDDPFHGPVERPSASVPEVDKLLDTVNTTLDVGLDRSEILGTFAGLRPLVAPSDAGSTVKVSREHKVSVEAAGLVRISGGKYTTYRLMARDAVDAVLGADAAARPSKTADLPITGAAARSDLEAMAIRLAAEPGVGEEGARSLVDRYGITAKDVVALGRERDLVRPLVAGHAYLEAEVAWAVEHELAVSLDDILSRRLRLAMALPDRGESIAARVASITGDVLGWDESRQAAEAAAYLEGAHREFDVPSA